MNNENASALVNSLVPMIAGFIRGVVNEKGTVPTDKEVLEWLEKDSAAVLAVSDAWLAAHAQPNLERDKNA